LDISSSGPRWLADPRIAAVVVEALHHRSERVYDLLAFCVMPNHVHLVCTPLQREDGTYHALHRILQSLKRHTARQANKTLKRQGAFWQAESYDHIVRDTDELARIVQYVINNPVKAGLASDWEAWPWTYMKV
jgi:putative transposase